MADRPDLLDLARCEVGRAPARRRGGAGVRRRADQSVRLRRAAPDRRGARGPRRGRVPVHGRAVRRALAVARRRLRAADLSAPAARDPLAPRPHRRLRGALDRRARLRPDPAARRRDRQPRPAHRRRHPRLRRERARPLALAARLRRDADLVRRSLVEPVERMGDPDRRRRAAAGAGAPAVGGDRLLGRLDVAHPPARPPPRADQLRPLPLRGGLPLRPGPLPRPRGGGGAQPGRSRRAARGARSLPQRGRRLPPAGSRGAPAQHPHRDARSLEQPRAASPGRAVLLQRARDARADRADASRLRSGVRGALLVRERLSRDRALASQHRAARGVQRRDGRHRARPRSSGDPGRHRAGPRRSASSMSGSRLRGAACCSIAPAPPSAPASGWRC